MASVASRTLQRLNTFLRPDPVQLVVARCAKFHRTLYVEGSVSDEHHIETARGIGALAASLQTSGPSFSVQVLYAEELATCAAQIEFRMRDGRQVVFNPMEVSGASDRDLFANALMVKFHERVAGMDRPKLLDIGGRSRSKVDRSKDFPNADVTVLDVLPGENVDVVGDAHAMSELFPPEHFDAAYSIAVFEHLLMPWRVAVEMNAVLKPGAMGYVLTHQTLGMHDMPWDFWRYSDTAWDAIFNAYTGFEIVERLLSSSQFVVPFKITPGKMDSEKAAGFEGSVVLFRKTGPAKVRWDVPPSVIQSQYPA